MLKIWSGNITKGADRLFKLNLRHFGKKVEGSIKSSGIEIKIHFFWKIEGIDGKQSILINCKFTNIFSI